MRISADPLFPALFLTLYLFFFGFLGGLRGIIGYVYRYGIQGLVPTCTTNTLIYKLDPKRRSNDE